MEQRYPKAPDENPGPFCIRAIGRHPLWEDNPLDVEGPETFPSTARRHAISGMKYFIAIEPASDDDSGFGVAMPDLPGAFSQGATAPEAAVNAREAVRLWLETAAAEGMPLPRPSSLPALRAAHPEWSGRLWSDVEVEVPVR